MTAPMSAVTSPGMAASARPSTASKRLGLGLMVALVTAFPSLVLWLPQTLVR